jgi:hypothetical protein
MDSEDVGKYKTSKETGSGDLLVAIGAAIKMIEDQLKTTGCEKGSLTDLVRLLQLRKELEGDLPRRINARWIDEDEWKTLTD